MVALSAMISSSFFFWITFTILFNLMITCFHNWLEFIFSCIKESYLHIFILCPKILYDNYEKCKTNSVLKGNWWCASWNISHDQCICPTKILREALLLTWNKVENVLGLWKLVLFWIQLQSTFTSALLLYKELKIVIYLYSSRSKCICSHRSCNISNNYQIVRYSFI